MSPMNHETNKKLNNKGFSLVELIIVIAIMAVLICVLAPQYLRYVERSRNSTDQSNAAAIESALQVWASEPVAPAGTVLFATDATGTTVTVTANNDIAFAGANDDAAQDALENAGFDLATRCSSRSRWVDYVITVVVDANGTVTVNTVYRDAAGAAVTP